MVEEVEDEKSGKKAEHGKQEERLKFKEERVPIF